MAHGEWESWLLSIDMPKTNAYEFVRVYEQFAEVRTSEHLTFRKMAEMLSLPVEVDRQQFVEQSHTIPSTQETKTVDEMTVRMVTCGNNRDRDANTTTWSELGESKRGAYHEIDIQIAII